MLKKLAIAALVAASMTGCSITVKNASPDQNDVITRVRISKFERDDEGVQREGPYSVVSLNEIKPGESTRTSLLMPGTYRIAVDFRYNSPPRSGGDNETFNISLFSLFQTWDWPGRD